MKYLEPGVFTVVAIFLAAMAFPQCHLPAANAVYPSEVWLKRSDLLSAFSAVAAAAAAMLSVSGIASIRLTGKLLASHALDWSRSVMQELRSIWSWLLTQGHSPVFSRELMSVVLIGIAIRSYFLAQPIRYDEAYTFLEFVDAGVQYLFFYPLPNNHVLHTLFVRCSVVLFGSNPVAIRLPAVLAGIANIPLVFLVTRRIAGSDNSGLVAAAFMAVCPYVVLFDTMARGYSLVTFLGLFLIVIGLWMNANPSTQVSLLMGLVIAVGLCVMPSFLFAAAGVLTWVVTVALLERRPVKWLVAKMLIPCGLMTVILTALFYAPVILVTNAGPALTNSRFP